MLYFKNGRLLVTRPCCDLLSSHQRVLTHTPRTRQPARDRPLTSGAIGGTTCLLPDPGGDEPAALATAKARNWVFWSAPPGVSTPARRGCIALGRRRTHADGRSVLVKSQMGKGPKLRSFAAGTQQLRMELGSGRANCRRGFRCTDCAVGLSTRSRQDELQCSGL